MIQRVWDGKHLSLLQLSTVTCYINPDFSPWNYRSSSQLHNRFSKSKPSYDYDSQWLLTETSGNSDFMSSPPKYPRSHHSSPLNDIDSSNYQMSRAATHPPAAKAAILQLLQGIKAITKSTFQPEYPLQIQTGATHRFALGREKNQRKKSCSFPSEGEGDYQKKKA